MSEIFSLAPSVLEISEQGIVTGGWLRQLRANKKANYESALARGRKLGDYPRGFPDLFEAVHYFTLAQRAARGDFDWPHVLQAIKAVQTAYALEMEDFHVPELGGFDYITGRVPYKANLGHGVLSLASGIERVSYVERRGLLRRRHEVAHDVARYAVLAVRNHNVTVFDADAMRPFEFAQVLQPLVYAAKPLYYDGVVTIDGLEVIRTAESEL
jgi:hypothetical protein